MSGMILLISGRSGVGRNKLRTYRLFKSIYTYGPEKYCRFRMPLSHRAAFAKFRCEVAPIRNETGRFENLDVSLRLCHICNVVENEAHVMLECSAYMISETVCSIKLPQFFQILSLLTPTKKCSFYLVIQIWFVFVPKPVLKFFSSAILYFTNTMFKVFNEFK